MALVLTARVRTMKRTLFPAALLAALALDAGTILTGRLAGRYDTMAVEELLAFLPKITGEKWQAVPEEKRPQTTGNVIYLGDTAFAHRNGIDRAQLPPEGWILRSCPGGLIVTGGYPVGTLYGAYDLLKRCGVRFLAMDETVVPAGKNFRFPRFDVAKQPSYEARFIYDNYPNLVINQRKADEKIIHETYNRHRLRLGICGTQLMRHPSWYVGEYDKNTVGATGHTYVYYVNPKKYMKDHPEYYSMDEKGRRFFGQLCFSNRAVWDVIYDELRAYIIRDRKEAWHGVGKYRRRIEKAPRSYKIFQMDGYNYLCLCPECRKISEADGDSGLQMRALNYVARKIRAEFPDVEIAAGAYCSTDTVPKVTRPEKNVSVSWVDLYLKRDPYRPMTHPVNAKQLAKFEAWNKIAKMAVYDYWNMGGKYYFYPPRQEVVTDTVIADLRFYRGRGVRRFFTEYEKDAMVPQPFFDLHCYLAAELLMDVEADAEKIISEFIRGYYGEKASPAVSAYLAELRRGVSSQPGPQFTMLVRPWRFATPEFLYDSYRRLAAAEKAAGPETKYGRRIRELLLPLLWEVCAYRRIDMPLFVKNGVSEDQVRAMCLRYVTEYIGTYGGKAVPELVKNAKERLDYLFVDLPFGDRFPGYSANDVKVFGYPHARVRKGIAEIVDDPDTPVGKAVCCYGLKDTVHSVKTRNPTLSWLWLTTFAMHDGKIPRGTISLRVKKIPQDEKYHWYKMPQPLQCAKGDINFWTFYGYLHLDMSSLYRPADGRDDMNTYDIWFSAKYTGPGYVKGSTKRNAVWVDRVVAVWKGAKPAAQSVKKGDK